MRGPVTVTIPRLMPSQNVTQYRHWWQYKKIKDEWFALVRSVLRPKQKPEHRVKVLIVSYRFRLCDVGNLIGGAKPIPDALIRLGWLRDDNPRWCDITYRQHQCPLPIQRTLITIYNP